jgi:flagellin-specific chaperone FliS
MYIAQDKLKTNISEYVLYMFHIEDVIRVCHLNIDEIEKNILPGYKLPLDETEQVKGWYKNLIAQMEKDDLYQSGHTRYVKEIMFQLNDLHISLLNNLQEEQYAEYYQWAKPIINELKGKMKTPSLTEIEVCFDGLYEFMLLKMKHKEITTETSDAMSVFIQLLRYLSKKYHAIKEGN